MMPYCAFVESRIYETHRGEQTKFFGHQVAGGRLNATSFPKGNTFLRFL
jgi:hypothetical protein